MRVPGEKEIVENKLESIYATVDGINVEIRNLLDNPRALRQWRRDLIGMYQSLVAFSPTGILCMDDYFIRILYKRFCCHLLPIDLRDFRSMVALLCERGADVNAVNSDGGTPLHDAGVFRSAAW